MLLENRGHRVSLRALQPEDANWLAQAYATDSFARLYRANAEVPSEEFLRNQLTERNRHSPGEVSCIEFAIIHPEAGPVGLIGMVDYSLVHRRAELLVGIVDEKYRHAFIAVEASLLALELAFNHYGLNKLYTYVYGYNPYAEKNTLKLGFRQEGLLKDHHYSVRDKCFVDRCMNGMTLNDYRNSTQVSRLSTRLLGRDITVEPQQITVNEPISLPTEQQAALIAFLTGQTVVPT